MPPKFPYGRRPSRCTQRKNSYEIKIKKIEKKRDRQERFS